MSLNTYQLKKNPVKIVTSNIGRKILQVINKKKGK
ncbi:hypothetical protein CP061683_0132A, partial [Chlamydia psittaci 06-1683]